MEGYMQIISAPEGQSGRPDYSNNVSIGIPTKTDKRPYSFAAVTTTPNCITTTVPKSQKLAKRSVSSCAADDFVIFGRIAVCLSTVKVSYVGGDPDVDVGEDIRGLF